MMKLRFLMTWLSARARQRQTRVFAAVLAALVCAGSVLAADLDPARLAKIRPAMLSKGSFGHGGAFGTQGWIDPEKDLIMVLMIQRIGLPNADASPMRRQFQTIAVSVLEK